MWSRLLGRTLLGAAALTMATNARAGEIGDAAGEIVPSQNKVAVEVTPAAAREGLVKQLRKRLRETSGAAVRAGIDAANKADPMRDVKVDVSINRTQVSPIAAPAPIVASSPQVTVVVNGNGSNSPAPQPAPQVTTNANYRATPVTNPPQAAPARTCCVPTRSSMVQRTTTYPPRQPAVQSTTRVAATPAPKAQTTKVQVQANASARVQPAPAVVAKPAASVTRSTAVDVRAVASPAKAASTANAPSTSVRVNVNSLRPANGQ